MLAPLPRPAVLDLSGFTQRLQKPFHHFSQHLFEIIATHLPDLVSLSVSGNDIDRLPNFRQLAQYAPLLVNLSLAGNRIRDLNELSHLRAFRDTLETLDLSDNAPLVALDPSLVTFELATRFPNLKTFNNNPVQPMVQFGLPARISSVVKLPPVAGAFRDSEDTNALIQEFLGIFFPNYDSQRPALRLLYAPNASFSLTLPNDSRSPDELRLYAELNRNLLRDNFPGGPGGPAGGPGGGPGGPAGPGGAAGAGAADPRLFTGPDAILYALSRLPRSDHDMSGFVTDAFVVPTVSQYPLMHLTVHGQFLDLNTQCIVSFYRVFALSPPAQGSEAESGQLRLVILSDQLHLLTRTRHLEAQQQQQVAYPGY